MYEYGVYENDYALAPLVSNGLAWDEWNPEIPNEFIESPPEPIVEMPPYRRLPRSLRTLTPLENMNKVYEHHVAQYLKPFSEQDALPSFADVAQLMGLDGRYLPHRPQIFPNGEMDSILVPAIPQLRNVRFRPTPPKDFNIPKTNLILQTVRMEKRIGAISERTRLDTELGDVIIHTPENALQAAIALIASRAGCVGFHMSALQVLCEAVQFKIRSLCLDLNSISDGCKVSDSDELIKFVSALLSVKLLDAPHPEEALTSLAQHYQEVEVNPFLEMKTEYESVSSSKRTRRSTGSMNS